MNRVIVWASSIVSSWRDVNAAREHTRRSLQTLCEHNGWPWQNHFCLWYIYIHIYIILYSKITQNLNAWTLIVNCMKLIMSVRRTFTVSSWLWILRAFVFLFGSLERSVSSKRYLGISKCCLLDCNFLLNPPHPLPPARDHFLFLPCTPRGRASSRVSVKYPSSW